MDNGAEADSDGLAEDTIRYMDNGAEADRETGLLRTSLGTWTTVLRARGSCVCESGKAGSSFYSECLRRAPRDPFTMMESMTLFSSARSFCLFVRF